MPTPNTKIAADAAYRRLETALRRDATREAYARVQDRIRGMLAFDHDLDHVAHAGIEQRYTTLLNSIKDFATFLESYVAQSERIADQELHQ